METEKTLVQVLQDGTIRDMEGNSYSVAKDGKIMPDYIRSEIYGEKNYSLFDKKKA